MTERNIQLLDEETVNQIAAGEVIEHPASVVKELVENAVDAGSSRILIETLGAGRSLIQVIDNGYGMNRDNLLIAPRRFATSKIRSFTDLYETGSMGFRGEALASIASVSKLSIITSLDQSGKGHCLELPEEHCYPTSSLKGTKVQVRSLFYNVPVRRRFQKSENKDRLAISHVLVRLALCYPSISFSWKSEGKLQWEVEANEAALDRIQKLLGDEISNQFLPIDEKNETFHLKGFIGSCEMHRPNRTGQILFVNQRSITSYFLSQAFLEGYGTYLPTRPLSPFCCPFGRA